MPQAFAKSLQYKFCPEVAISWSGDKVTCSAPWISTTFQLPFSPATEQDRQDILALIPETAIRYPIVLAYANSIEGEARLGNPSVSCVAEIEQKFWTSNRRFPGYSWDLASVLTFARSYTNYDAVAAFSHIRRLQFKAMTANDENCRLVVALDRLPRERLIEVFTHILNQSFFVTSQCVSALSAAEPQRKQSPFHSALSDYILEEDGHHKLIVSALAGLGQVSDDAKVHWSVRHAINLLRWCAPRSSLALAACIGLFEQASFSDTDPIAKRLDGLGFPDAAKPLWTHFSINKKGEHACIGLDLAALLSDVTVEDIFIAGRCAEMLTSLFSETEKYYIELAS